jgi:hypothetical protein
MDFWPIILRGRDKMAGEGAIKIMKQLGLALCALGLLLSRMSIPSFYLGSSTVSYGPAAKSLGVGTQRGDVDWQAGWA